MFVAHAPAGYLVGVAAERFGLHDRMGRLVAVAGALAPDIDMLLWLADPRYHHHRWPTHWPVCWALFAGVAACGLRVPRLRRHSALGVVFAISGLLHQVLDTIVGDIRWLAPWSTEATSLFVVDRVHEPWWLNFLVHPSFFLEVVLVCAATAVFVARQRTARG